MRLARLLPRSITGQMMAVLGASFVLLLVVLTVLEFLEYDNVADTADSDVTVRRLARVLPIVQNIGVEESIAYLHRISHCHDGYAISEGPYSSLRESDQATSVLRRLVRELSIDAADVRVGFATLMQSDFSYDDCAPNEMSFPLQGIVVSIRIAPRRWLNAEVHPHEWHVTPSMTDWLLRSGAAFLIIGCIAVFFVRRVSQPLKTLTDAAGSFAADFEVTNLKETGPPDVRRAIRSFNDMQQQVRDEMGRRTNTLAAISHDIRSPLTALRVKAELVENDELRGDQIASIEKMERITATALAFLKGESRSEPKRTIDLGALVESVCNDQREAGADVRFTCTETIQYSCRADALYRAVNNLIDNSIKYAGKATVSVEQDQDSINIVVVDQGPGISVDELTRALEPFERLSAARNSDAGGFGLGLAIVKAVTEGHDGVLSIVPNIPQGLLVMIKLPIPLMGEAK